MSLTLRLLAFSEHTSRSIRFVCLPPGVELLRTHCSKLACCIHTLGMLLLLTAIVVATGKISRAGDALRFGGPAVSADGSAAGSVSFDQISHAALDVMLQHYIDCDGQVCYSDWQDSRCDMNQLCAYITSLSQVDPLLPSNDEAMMAYYINAYNALTIWGILREYPVASIQRIDGKRAQFAIFDDLQFWAGDRYLSLNGIENDVLRPLGDPRIHFALVCAAKGCPRLRNRAYTAEQLHWQLDDNAREFFADRNRFHLSKLTRTVKMSPILKWYRVDFGQTDHQVVQTVFQYLPAEDRQWLSCHPGWKFEYLGYNWALNDQCPTLGVAFAAGPYRAWSKVSPKVEPLKDKLLGGSKNSANDAGCGCADVSYSEAFSELSPGVFTAPGSELPIPDFGEPVDIRSSSERDPQIFIPAPYSEFPMPQVGTGS